jgi:hypothetical protein
METNDAAERRDDDWTRVARTSGEPALGRWTGDSPVRDGGAAATRELGEVPEPTMSGALVPEQRSSGVVWSGEVRLAAAILEDAIRICRKRPFGRLFREACTWIASDDRSAVFSFLAVCDVLGLDAGAVRARLGRTAAAGARQGGGERRATTRRAAPRRASAGGFPAGRPPRGGDPPAG